MMAWGLNSHGQCGVGVQSAERSEEHDTACPYPLPSSIKLAESGWVKTVCLPRSVCGLPPISEVHSGWSHSLAVSGDALSEIWLRIYIAYMQLYCE